MASTADIRKGLTLQMEGQIFEVADFQHVKPGKGGAFVRITLRNARTGRVIERTLNSGASIETVRVDGKDLQFLYSDGEFYHFMDQESYDQFQFGGDWLGDKAQWLKEGVVCRVNFLDTEALTIELPNFLELTIKETAPGFKGDTVSNTGKPAILETGAEVAVPLFCETGDVVRVDTRTGEYLDRVKRAG
ncbi:MAG: elongation factor P [bacterium]|nr:elongation factor P [bacterium]